MGNMGSGFGIKHVLMNTGGEGGTGGGSGGTGGGAAAFADAAAARAYLADWTPKDNADFYKTVGDDKIVGVATHFKTRADDIGKNFPGNWREQFAGENKDDMATLQRLGRPHDLFTSYKALRTKMSDGSLRSTDPFPEKGDDAAKAAWRQTNGVPATAEDYVKNMKLGAGFKIESDEDKGVLKGFSEYAHKNHIPQAVHDAVVNWMFESRRSGEEVRTQQDKLHQQETEDALRAKYGNDYRGNIGRIQPFLDMAPAGVKDMIVSARGGDGRFLMHHPDFNDWLVGLARQVNPAGVLIPGSGGNLTQSIETELKGIHAKMGTQEYIKSDAMQARYRDLLDAYQKATGKEWNPS